MSRQRFDKHGKPLPQASPGFKAFRRAIAYMLPYKARITAIVVCVVIIATLWATGLSIMLPAAKIFFSEEGLHGWVDKQTVEHRLDVKLDNVQLGQARQDAWGHITHAAIVRSIGEKLSPAGMLAKDDYFVGVDGNYVDFEPLMRQIAGSAQDWPLVVYNAKNDRTETVTLHARPATQLNRLFMWSVGKVARPTSYPDRFTLFAWVLGVGLVLNIIRDMFRVLQDYLVQTTVQRGMIDLRRENFATALHLPMSHYALQGTSDTISRFIADIGQLSNGLITLFGKTLVEPAKLLGCFVLALLVNWKLTLLACLAGPPTFALIRKMGSIMRKATRKVLRNQSQMLWALNETLTGIRVVKAYTTEQYEQDRFKQITRQLYKEIKPMSLSDALTGPAIESLGISAAMVAAAFAGYQVFHGRMKPEDFFVLLAVLAGLFDPVRKLSSVITKFHASDAAAQRVFELSDRQVETDAPDAIDLARHHKSIEFRDLTFTYANAVAPRSKRCRSPSIKASAWPWSAATARARPRSCPCSLASSSPSRGRS